MQVLLHHANIGSIGEEGSSDLCISQFYLMNQETIGSVSTILFPTPTLK